MKLKAWLNYTDIGEPFILLNSGDCKEIGIDNSLRARVKGKNGYMFVSVIKVEDDVTPCGLVEAPSTVLENLGNVQGDIVDVSFASKPSSMSIIKKKIEGKCLTKEEINTVIRQIASQQLSNFEIASWIAALHVSNMNTEEISNMVEAIANDSKIIKFNNKSVFDFHSLGGVPGNKITPIVVSIVAAAGLMLPKTSTRAISSACGTIDFVELFCNPMLTTEEIKNVAEKTGGCLAWTGGIGISSSDNIMINVEHQMNINPSPLMMASIICEKIVVGSTHLLMDIPVGSGTKITDINVAREYANKFVEIGKRIGMHIECAITYAEQPVGSAIGPMLEARECIRVLEGETDCLSVVEKACKMAGIILEMGGIENGFEKASEILSSGEALRKFRGIVKAQGGNENIKSSDFEPGKYRCEIKSTKAGLVQEVKNDLLVKIAKAAGAPSDKGAGLLIHKRNGEKVKVDDVLFEIYADFGFKCEYAKSLTKELSPFIIEGLVIESSL